MIEGKGFPVETNRGMAGFAGFIKLTPVRVLVAIDTAGLQRLVNHDTAFNTGKMAFGTGSGPVFTGERVAAGIMIEGDRFETLHPVAGFAIPVELSFVRVFPVAVAAIGEGRFFRFLAGGMTFLTGKGPVLTPKRIPGLIMIENRNPP